MASQLDSQVRFRVSVPRLIKTLQEWREQRNNHLAHETWHEVSKKTSEIRFGFFWILGPNGSNGSKGLWTVRRIRFKLHLDICRYHDIGTTTSVPRHRYTTSVPRHRYHDISTTTSVPRHRYHDIRGCLGFSRAFGGTGKVSNRLLGCFVKAGVLWKGKCNLWCVCLVPRYPLKFAVRRAWLQTNPAF